MFLLRVLDEDEEYHHMAALPCTVPTQEIALTSWYAGCDPWYCTPWLQLPEGMASAAAGPINSAPNTKRAADDAANSFRFMIYPTAFAS
jgi:hypothetical protein